MNQRHNRRDHILQYSGGGIILPWYLSGGVTPANCIAVYQAKGAASYAASLVNLKTPGTCDLTETNGAVTWDAVNGFQFVAAGTKALDTGILANGTTSVFVRFAGAASGCAVGSAVLNAYFLDWPKTGADYAAYWANAGWTVVSVGGAYAAGTYCHNAIDIYKNGAFLYNFAGKIWGGISLYALTLGADHTGVGVYDSYFTGNILACSIYSAALSAPQITAIHTAISAL